MTNKYLDKALEKEARLGALATAKTTSAAKQSQQRLQGIRQRMLSNKKNLDYIKKYTNKGLI